MDLLLSSPVAVTAGVIFVVIFIGVFLYELRQQKKQREVPPVTHIPPNLATMTKQSFSPPPLTPTTPGTPITPVGHKKKSHKGLILASSLTMFLLVALGGTVYLTQQQQFVFNFAQAPAVSPTSPLRPTIGSTQSVIAPTIESTNKEIALAKTSPTVSPTSLATGSISCIKLSADPATGSAPLQVTFTGEGQVGGGEVNAFQFIFGDGTDKTIERTFEPNTPAKQQVIYTYQQKGIYRASLRVRDKAGKWSSTPVGCIVSITVNDSSVKVTSPTPKAVGGPSASTSATPTAREVVKPKVPEAGSFTPTVLFVVGGVLLIGLSTLLLRF